uniref:Uncharacterized protein n=1 Tax=Haptolina brevifila TaxID=156173 RepID=A0A7S2GN47_9EUKA|mmetsp:Transcript_4308/g.9458  ORF Transcript_4308/g.9458 Transcript_4308/m.9458 type:complete len:214 (+) Transcript_4308:52-693(+)
MLTFSFSSLFAGLFAPGVNVTLGSFAPGVDLALGGCSPNTTHGCLDSQPYEWASQFPCGSHHIYDYKSTLCCEQGRPFSVTDEYCCTGSGMKGIHSYGDGKCDLAGTDDCACYDDIALPMPKKAMPNQAALVDTSKPPEGGYLCSGAKDGQGCMNGWPYNYSKFAPCGECCSSPAQLPLVAKRPSVSLTPRAKMPAKGLTSVSLAARPASYHA